MTEMLEMFKKTGAQGGKKRAANMSKKERSESARKAAQARWAKKSARKNKRPAKEEA
jgi:hypothetical protein